MSERTIELQLICKKEEFDKEGFIANMCWMQIKQSKIISFKTSVTFIMEPHTPYMEM